MSVGENGGYKGHLSSPGFCRRSDQGWSSAQIQGTGLWLSVLSLSAVVHGFACLLLKKMLPYLSFPHWSTHMSHRVTLCDPTNFSLSFYPDWICHLAEVVQLCIWLEVWCLGMKCYELMVGLFYREVSHSSRTWLQTNLLFIMNVQGTCQSCGAVGPNLWACLQVKMACLCAWCGGTLLQ